MCLFLISAPDEDILVKGKQSIKSQVLGNQNSESEILLEGDDDITSFIEEREVENLTGNFSYLISHQLLYCLSSHLPCTAVTTNLGYTPLNFSFP